MIFSFRGYSFCKAHSASYAQLSFRLGYIKCHFSAEFWVAVINNGGGYYSRQTYLNEARRKGFKIYLPDVNHSSYEYTLEKDGLRIGLSQLRSISFKFLKRLFQSRLQKGFFKDFSDFRQRIKPNWLEVSCFIRSGALDSIAADLTRPELFYQYFQFGKKGKDYFDFFPANLPVNLKDYSQDLKLKDELETLGLLASCHPLSLFQKRLKAVAQSFSKRPLITSEQIPLYKKKQILIGGFFVSAKEVFTQKQDSMLFVSFEDEYSIFETVFFPQVLRRYREYLKEAAVFLIAGVVSEESGSYLIKVDALKRLSRRPDPLKEMSLA